MILFAKLCACGDLFVLEEREGHLIVVGSPYGTGPDAYRMLATMPDGKVMTCGPYESLAQMERWLSHLGTSWVDQLRFKGADLSDIRSRIRAMKDDLAVATRSPGNDEEVRRILRDIASLVEDASHHA